MDVFSSSVGWSKRVDFRLNLGIEVSSGDRGLTSVGGSVESLLVSTDEPCILVFSDEAGRASLALNGGAASLGRPVS